jgi:hypothetical protein
VAEKWFIIDYTWLWPGDSAPYYPPVTVVACGRQRLTNVTLMTAHDYGMATLHRTIRLSQRRLVEDSGLLMLAAYGYCMVTMHRTIRLS